MRSSLPSMESNFLTVFNCCDLRTATSFSIEATYSTIKIIMVPVVAMWDSEIAFDKCHLSLIVYSYNSCSTGFKGSTITCPSSSVHSVSSICWSWRSPRTSQYTVAVDVASLHSMLIMFPVTEHFTGS